MGNFELALENMERALNSEPDNEIFRKARYMVMEKLPVEDPLTSPGCPDIDRIYRYLAGEMKGEDSETFRKHTEQCLQCSLWFELMGKVVGKGKNSEKMKNSIPL